LTVSAFLRRPGIAAASDTVRRCSARRERDAPLNAVLFGVLIASGALPLDQLDSRAAIRRTQKAVDSKSARLCGGLRAGHPCGYARVPCGPVLTGCCGAFDRRLPAAGARISWHAGSNRLVDYQGKRYAQLYLDRLWPVLRVEEASGSTDFPLARETAPTSPSG